jgi:hypothetical protein
MEDDMTTQTQPQFRHSFRPLNVFTFCGQPVTAPRGEYLRATRDLPPCPDCQRARDAVARMLGSTYRLPSAAGSFGPLTAA